MEGPIQSLRSKGFSLVSKLQGDASKRQFYRLERRGEYFVAMYFPEQGLELQLRVHRFLSVILPLPRIYEVFPEQRLILMEDAGDLSLEKFVKGGGEWKPVYKELLGLLEALQRYGSAIFPQRHPVRERALNRERLLRELRFTYENFIRERTALSPEPWERFSLYLVDSIDYSRMVPNHRDFHSRNIFIKKGKLLILDYQDCMMGPSSYDYASLLRDNYVRLPSGERLRMEEPFLNENYLLVSLQRHFKALGTFGSQINKGKEYFSRYIPLTLKYIEEEAEEINGEAGLFVKREILHRIYGN